MSRFYTASPNTAKSAVTRIPEHVRREQEKLDAAKAEFFAEGHRVEQIGIGIGVINYATPRGDRGRTAKRLEYQRHAERQAGKPKPRRGASGKRKQSA